MTQQAIQISAKAVIMYDPSVVRHFYDQYGTREWERLDGSAHARLIFHLHMKFMKDHVGSGRRVADIGCGGGRFSIPIAQAANEVILVDNSPEQLRIAREKVAAHHLEPQVAGYVAADICDLSALPDRAFDTVLCYGGVLNYLCERLPLGLAELTRITRPGGTILLSVNSCWGLQRFAVANAKLDPITFFGNPGYWKIFEVAATGDLPGFPETSQPPRHFFTSAELAEVLASSGIHVDALATAASVNAGLHARLDAIEQVPEAWSTLLRLEEMAFETGGLLDGGEFLMARGTVQ